MTHSASYWHVRCIEDTSSEDENTPPNQQRDGYQGRANRLKVEDVESDSGTATPPGLSPQRAKGVRLPKAVTNPPPGDEPSDHTPATPPPERNPRSPTTSSPVLLETPPTPRLAHAQAHSFEKAANRDKIVGLPPPRTLNGVPRILELRHRPSTQEAS
ncbi:hypothetical protein PI124_g10469 [Phytophthora idaei]|nr:hypothetical protein PI125_g3614 [Phytophthora idaei]KAG3148403.1 hypothetical protein PI126_g12452 [Phytophthora idaei]KAG3244769.1 hypothetical protein PI124_g10469 [Phytophthora idaei]